MKKIYSFMLLAAAMLLSISVSADVTSTSELQTAFNNANDGDVIEIGADFSLDALVKIDLGTNSVTLDLQGHTISAASTLKEMFYLYKGKLLVTNGTIQHVGAPMNTSGSGIAPLIFKVFGTYGEVLPGEYTKLTIAENASLLVAGGGANYKSNGTFKDYCKGYCISINERAETAAATKALDTRVVGWPNQTGTAGSQGLANGVLIEVNGHLSMMSKKGYCIKVNGNLVCPSNNDIAGTTFTRGGNSYTIAADWNQYTPKVILSSSATLVATANATGVAAIYAAGYGTWDIQCHAEGSCALAAKSGNIVVTDAVLTSTATEYSQPATKGSGIDAQGSAVLIESNASYAGNISVTFAGDTKVEAQAGYAIEEAVPTPASGSAVSSISIQGGAFEGGAQAGCITFSEGTLAKHDESTVITIGGGSYGDQTDAQKEATDRLISHIINGGNTYTTEVSTGSTSGTGVVLVITSGTTPEIQPASFDISDLYAKHSDSENPEDWNSIDLSNVIANTTFELELGDDKGNLTLGDVVMNGEDLTIIVNDGVTFTAKQLIMNDKARIIVKAGGKLIVTGEQGIIAPVVDNILIEAQEGNMGLFLFNPAVSSNRHPHGTVELISKAYKDGNHQVSQRFGVPAWKGITRANVGRNVPTGFVRWDIENGWVDLATNEKMMPFEGYALSILLNQPGERYTFACDSLVGNANADLNFPANHKWGYFANSYTGELDIYDVIAMIEATGKAESAIQFNLSSTDNYWRPISKGDFDDLDVLGFPISKIAPMQCFITRTLSSTDAPFKATLNYASMLWNHRDEKNHAIGIEATNNAPARRNMVQSSDYTRAGIVIANGETEQYITLRQSARFSDEFDNGYDASLYKVGNFNIYANSEEGELAQIATDNLIGKTLTVEATKAASFKMTFDGLKGETLAIRDNMTGSVINMVAGEEYFFSVAPGTTADRFEIVEAAKMPTDVEMLEAAPAKKGIYTLVGQYLGENFDVLPAGIYVVNGKKVVK